jgi:hypothetical protein
MLIESTAHLPISLAMFDGVFNAPDGAALGRIILRWSTFVAGITWIGLLYFFNLVNVPCSERTRCRHEEEGQSRSARSCALVLSLGRGGDGAGRSDLLRDVHPRRDVSQRQHSRNGNINIWYVWFAWLLYPIVLFVIEFLIIKKVPALIKMVACLRL